MNRLLTAYRNFLKRYPTGSQAIQTGLLMGTGDMIAQVFVEGKSLKEFSFIRTGQFALIGTIFVGPALRAWYVAMDKHIGSTGKTVAVKKVLADQLVFAPVFMAAIMCIVGVVQGHSWDNIKGRLMNDYPDVFVNNYKLWPAVQLCNFYLVPLQFQVITVQFVALFWNTYLSWKMNQEIKSR